MLYQTFGDEIVALIPDLRAYALSLSRSNHRADDLVQDTLERAWRARSSFIGGQTIKAWLVTIMRNRFIDVCRLEQSTVEDVGGLHAAKITTLPNQVWAVQYSQLVSAVCRLPPQSSEAISLVYFAGLTHEEASVVLGCPLGSVKSRIRRASKNLRDVVDIEDIK